MGALTHNGEIMQSLPANASQINFDKTGTDLNSTQTENAIKEVNEKVNTNAEDITQLKSGFLTVKTATVSDERFSNVTVSEVGGVKSLYIATTGGNTALDTTADYVEYFTLPVGFRPANLYYNRFISKKSATTTDTDWVIKIDTNGKVYLVNYNGEEHPGFANTFVFI